MKLAARLLLLSGLFATLLVLRAPHRAYAHFLATDNSLTVLLHIDPNDEDTAPGQKATLNFIFDDSTNHFKLNDCSCRLIISQEGEQLDSLLLRPERGDHPSVYGSMVPFVFPIRSTYNISLSGIPIKVGDFQPFHLSWNLPITANPPPQPPPSHDVSSSTFLSYFAAILGVFLLLGLVLFVFA